jgi:drug/metabolite transporter (DMT)-like permease
MKKLNRLQAAYYTLLFFVLGSFTAFADDDFDPFLPDNPDPGDASIPYISLLLLLGVLYAGYYLFMKTTNTEKKTQIR